MALTTTAGSLGAANANVAVDVEQNSTFSGVVTGTFVGTVTFQALYDPTEGWVSAQTFTRPGVSAAAALTAPGNRIINTGGAIAVRAAMTAYTSGTAVVTLAGTPAASGASSGGGGGGGAVTVADGADVAEGTTTDAGIITDANGTVIGFLRGAIIQWAKNLTQLGIVTEAAPGTDTASSGLNGRLQRIAQRLTSLIALLPSALISNRLDVNLGAAPATVTMQGDVASGSADSGNPIKEGRAAVAHGADPTSVTAGQRTNLYANRHGIPFAIGGHPNVKTFAQNYTSAQTDTALVTIATGNKIVVTSVMVKCHTANTVNVSARVGFGTANVPAYGNAGLLLTDPGIAPGSGSGRGNGAGIVGVGADDEDLRVTVSVPTGGSVDCMATYYVVPS